MPCELYSVFLTHYDSIVAAQKHFTFTKWNSSCSVGRLQIAAVCLSAEGRKLCSVHFLLSINYTTSSGWPLQRCGKPEGKILQLCSASLSLAVTWFSRTWAFFFLFEVIMTKVDRVITFASSHCYDLSLDLATNGRVAWMLLVTVLILVIKGKIHSNLNHLAHSASLWMSCFSGSFLFSVSLGTFLQVSYWLHASLKPFVSWLKFRLICFIYACICIPYMYSYKQES